MSEDNRYPGMKFPEPEYREYPKHVGKTEQGEILVAQDAEEEAKLVKLVAGYVEPKPADFAPPSKK